MLSQLQPEFVPDDLWQRALVERRNYPRDWSTIIATVASRYNVSLKEAEEAQRKGIYSEYLRMKFQYGYSAEAMEWYKNFTGIEQFFPKEITNSGNVSS
jgi:hypothetical protein